MVIRIIGLSMILFCACGFMDNKSDGTGNGKSGAKRTIVRHTYSDLTIPQFFEAIVTNHMKDFYALDSLVYQSIGASKGIQCADSLNQRNFFSLLILHDLFTCQSAVNCSTGNILHIPYQWHWVQPNPRYTIYDTEKNVLLKELKPPKEFGKYQSCADIDRTPYLYLSDLVQAKVKYYSASCDSFSTFGWCSEREMAFVALNTLLGFKGKVVAEGNHSWSEFIVPMKMENGQRAYFKVKVDNTFDSISWSKLEDQEIPQWEAQLGNSPSSQWYNRKAKSDVDLMQIKVHKVSQEAAVRIENQIVNYLNKQING